MSERFIGSFSSTSFNMGQSSRKLAAVEHKHTQFRKQCKEMFDFLKILAVYKNKLIPNQSSITMKDRSKMFLLLSGYVSTIFPDNYVSPTFTECEWSRLTSYVISYEVDRSLMSIQFKGMPPPTSLLDVPTIEVIFSTVMQLELDVARFAIEYCQ